MTTNTKIETKENDNDAKLTAFKAAFEKADFKQQTFNATDIFASIKTGDDINAIREWAVNEKGLKLSKFNSALRRWNISNELDGYPETSMNFVELHTKKLGVTMKFNNLIESDNEVPEDVERTHRMEVERLGLNFSLQGVRDAHAEWAFAQKRARLEACKQLVKYDAGFDADTLFEDLAAAIADESETSIRFTTAVLKTVIWQVKRALNGLENYDHVMAILYGPQGGGKSGFWRDKFFADINDLMTDCNFDELTGKNDFDLWQFPIIFLDEMEKAGKADMDAIKNAITKHTNSNRKLYTGNRATVKCRHTCVGTMNGRLSERLNDPTGLRRFAGICFRKSPARNEGDPDAKVADWKIINEMDYLTLWKSVDHTAEHPLKADKKAYTEWLGQQEDERFKEPIEIWLLEIVPGGFKLGEDSGFTTTDMFTVFKEWCETNGYQYHGTSAQFGIKLRTQEKLKTFPFIRRDTKLNNKTVWNWNEDHIDYVKSNLVKDLI